MISYPAKKMLLLNTILFNDYIKKNTIKTKEDVKELFTVCEITEESVVKPISVNTGNKHDIIRLIEKATENTSIRINEDLIDEFVATAKSDSDAKEVLSLNHLSLNHDFFGKYIQIHKISTKKDLEELFKLSEISTRTRQVKIPNIFNKTDREIWYKTENFEKYGIPKGQLEQIKKGDMEHYFNIPMSANDFGRLTAKEFLAQLKQNLELRLNKY